MDRRALRIWVGGWGDGGIQSSSHQTAAVYMYSLNHLTPSESQRLYLQADSLNTTEISLCVCMCITQGVCFSLCTFKCLYRDRFCFFSSGSLSTRQSSPLREKSLLSLSPPLSHPKEVSSAPHYLNTYLSIKQHTVA